ncbi:MAG: acyloxyacyl hydrolase [Terriglobales bacterium]
MLLTCGAFAQSSSPPKNDFAVWFSRSFANGHAFGFIQDRSLTRLEFRYGRLLWSDYGLALRYVIDAVPVAVVGNPRVFGGGLSPVGAQMNFGSRHRVQPFLASNGGFLYFTRPTPAPDATQFNFSVFIAGGAQILASSRYGLDVGYMYHHFSNANVTNHNPALDAHMIFVGLSFLR